MGKEDLIETKNDKPIKETKKEKIETKNEKIKKVKKISKSILSKVKSLTTRKSK